DLAGLAKASPDTLQKAGIGESEAVNLVTEAKVTYNSQILKEIGIPAISLKKYIAAGISSPEDFVSNSPENLSKKTGMSVGTVNRHVVLVCEYLHRPIPVVIPKKRVEKGR